MRGADYCKAIGRMAIVQITSINEYLLHTNWYYSTSLGISEVLEITIPMYICLHMTGILMNILERGRGRERGREQQSMRISFNWMRSNFVIWQVASLLTLILAINNVFPCYRPASVHLLL